MTSLQRLAEEISQGIPDHFHVTLEHRLAIAWGQRKRNHNKGKPLSRNQIVAISRENRARKFYLRAQDENFHLFLPFVLAYSPRACVDLRPADFVEFAKYEKGKFLPGAWAETKQLIETMAIRRGFNKNSKYMKFMSSLFCGGSTVDRIATAARLNPSSPAISNANRPPNETHSGLTPSSETSVKNLSFSLLQYHLLLEKASLHGFANVFDDYMCSAIRKDEVLINGIICQKAAASMDFPPQGLVDCLMSLVVDGSKVGYLAMALFKVRVESMGQVRYVSLKEGVRLTPNPEITLKGVLDEAIIEVFGPEVHGAITTCRMHEKELEEGKRVTECVSMIITNDPSDPVIINLSLGLKGGVQIRNKLYT